MELEKTQYFLKEEVYFEPLFNHWYVWPHLLTPAQSARHVVNTHKRIMKSFVNNYQLHILACKESDLTGGEFLDCSEEQIEDIKGLIKEIDLKCNDLVEFSDAISQLDQLLREHTSGVSLEFLYDKVPDILKGYVELFFDLEHIPSYRFIESLLYKSRFYKEELQSISFGLLSKMNDRPFVLSTPRLPDSNHIQMNIPFNSPILKRILESRDIPLSNNEINALFSQCSYKAGFDYMELFETNNVEKKRKPVEHGVRLQYLAMQVFL